MKKGCKANIIRMEDNNFVDTLTEVSYSQQMLCHITKYRFILSLSMSVKYNLAINPQLKVTL